MTIKNYSNFSEDKRKCNLYVYEEIPNMNDGVSYYNTPYYILDELYSMNNVEEINLFINSGGGSVNTGFNMINLLNRYKAQHNTKINVWIDGIAASMAGILAIAVADELHLYNNSLLMIHLPEGMVSGNKKVVKEFLESLEQCEEQLINTFMNKAKDTLTIDLLTKLINNETWMNYEEINKYFNIKISLMDYNNNKTLLNLANYKSYNISTNKLDFLLNDKKSQILKDKLNSMKEFIISNY